jgi:osmoprotectant transport system substrate-binding protein
VLPVTLRLVAVVLSFMCMAGCADDTADQVRAPLAGSDEVITVASFDFTESRIVSEVYAQALDAWGYPAETIRGGAPREVIEPALEQGLVDLVPEYAGTALLFLTGDPTLVSADPVATHGHLTDAFASRDIAVLAAAPAQNQNALAVRRSTAVRHRLSTVSDLRTVASSMVLGGPPECPARPLCLIGFQDVYGLRFARFTPLDAGGPLTLAALQSGTIDVAVLFTGDRPVLGRDVVFLTDDRGLQPAENLTPVVRRVVLDAFGPELRRRLDRVTGLLTATVVARLVRAVDVERQDPAVVARRWLAETTIDQPANQ